MSQPDIIALDFDGTLVEGSYPTIGPMIGAFPILRRLQVLVDVRYILWTMRSGPQLDAAVALCEREAITLWGINENPTQRLSGWSLSNKAFAHLYIDDAALGCPRTPEGYADWDAIATLLEQRYNVSLRPTPITDE